MKKSVTGFTLVEIMIVVAIIGLLAAIAIPAFIQARQSTNTSMCIDHMRAIDSAMDQWALENGAENGDAVAEADILPYLKPNNLPTCPVGDTAYTLNNFGVNPQVECNNADIYPTHVMPGV